MTNVWLIAAGVLALLWWSMKMKADGSGDASVSVKGATVSVKNVDAVESSICYRYRGPVGNLVGIMDSGARPELELTTGRIYDRKPLLPGPIAGVGWIHFWVDFGARDRMGAALIQEAFPTADEWNQYWFKESLTVSEQNDAGGLVHVPDQLWMN